MMGEQREEGKRGHREGEIRESEGKKDPDTDSLEVESLGAVKGS